MLTVLCPVESREHRQDSQMLHCMHVEARMQECGVHHDGGAQLQVEVGLDALLGDSLGNTLGLAALELARQEVTQPALQQRHDAAQKE